MSTRTITMTDSDAIQAAHTLWLAARRWRLDAIAPGTPPALSQVMRDLADNLDRASLAIDPQQVRAAEEITLCDEVIREKEEV